MFASFIFPFTEVGTPLVHETVTSDQEKVISAQTDIVEAKIPFEPVE